MRNVRNLLIAISLFLYVGVAYGQSNYDFMNLYGQGVTCGYGFYQNAFHYTDGPAPGRHTLITQQGTDPNTGGELEIIPEGEDRVIRLGDAEAMHTAPGYAEGIEYQFEVNSLYSMLLLKFAVVFQEKVPNDHNIENKPFFSVKITDVNGNLLDDCAEYEVSSIGGLPGFHDYQLTPTSLIRWRDWSTIGLDLSRFAGQQVKVTFVTKDCAQGAHYGYAYFNAKCIPNFISASCVNGDVELEAPSYLQSYLWANNDTTQSITLPMPPYPAVLSTSCHLTSFTNCEMDLMATVVWDLDLPSGPQTVHVYNHCKGTPYNGYYFNIDGSELSEAGDYVFMNSIAEYGQCDSPTYLTLIIHVVDYIAVNYGDEICDNEEYNSNGFHIDSTQFQLGLNQYNFTHTHPDCCDSVFSLNLIVHPTKSEVVNDTICEGETYVFNGINYNTYSAGSYNDVAYLETVYGCDSIVEMNLVIHKVYDSTIYASRCQGEVFDESNFHITETNEAGTINEVQNLESQYGCDSIVRLELAIYPKDTTRYEASICYGESYIHQWDPSIHYDTPAVTETPIVDIYNYTSINNCDSVLILTLNVYPTYDTTITAYIGLGGTYNANGFNITPNGVGTIYQDLEPMPTTIHGCDSLVHLELAVYQTYEEHKYDEICDDNHGNNSYTNWGFNETGLSVAGSPYTFTRHLQTVNTHVDSTVIAHVTVYPVYDEHLYGQICEGVPYTNHGFSIQAPQTGEYQLTDLESVYGCDSLVTLHLSVIDHLYVDGYDTICENEIYNNYGFLIDSDTLDPGWHIYSHDAQSSTGCDSTFTLHLLVGENYSVFLNTRGCKYTTIDTLGMSFYLESDEYYDIITLPAVTGCDSTISVNIAVMPADREYFDVELCYGEGYDDDLHGFHIPDTIDPGHYVDSVIYISDNYSVAYYYLDTVCNSYYILNLDVWPLLDTTLYATVCDNNGAFSWNGFYYDGFDYGLRHDTVIYDVRHEQTVHGCDSTIYLELLVHPVLDTIFNESICEYESYSEHGFDQSHNFNITDLAPNQNYYYEFTVNSVVTGCDSTVRLNLYVRDVQETQLNISWCQNEEFDSLGFNITPTEVTVYDDFQIVSNASANGCDSLVYLALDVHPVYHLNDYTYIGLGDDYWGHGFYIQQPTLGHHILDTTYTTIHGCDSTWHVEFDVFPTYGTFVDTAICVGENYIHDPDTIQFIGYPAGTYVNEYHFQTVDGVDSTVFVTLTVMALAENHINIDWCQNDEFDSLGFNIMPTEAMTYNNMLVVPNGSYYGCDSIVYLTLDTHPVYHNNDYAYIGYGENYSGHGFNMQQPSIGQYILDTTYTTIHGCDSTWHVVLDVFETYGTVVDTTICVGEDYIHDPDTIQFIGYPVGTYTNEYHFQTINGVDSTVFITLRVNPIAEFSINSDWCQGEPYDINGFDLTPTELGILTDSLLIDGGSENGCDSIVHLTLDVHPVYHNEDYTFIGWGNNYEGHGFNMQLPDVGSYVLDTTYTTVDGCDSTWHVVLDVFQTYGTVIDTAICYGEDYIHDPDTIQFINYQVGTYVNEYHFLTIHGVDSTLYLTLHVNPVYDSIVDGEVCYDENYTLYNFNIEHPSVGYHEYEAAYQTIDGCDSTMYLHLNVWPSYDILIDTFIGTGYDYIANGFELIQPDEGVYDIDSLYLSVNDCDSIVRLHLDVYPTKQTYIHDSICYGEDYVINGFDMPSLEVGTHYDTLHLYTVHNVDSTVYLQLDVNEVFDTTFHVEICHGFDYVDNGFEFLQPTVGTHRDTMFLSSIHGCDSTVALELIVHPTYDLYIMDSICFDEDYMANGFTVIYPPVGITNDTLFLSSIYGCDSTVYLQLKVNPIYDNHFYDTVCDGEDYIGHGFVEMGKMVGVHYDTLYMMTQSGCDSISYLELTVNPTHNTDINGEICEGEDYEENGFSILQPMPGDSIYSIVLDNAFGCDSVVNLSLTVWPDSYRYLYDTVCHGVDYLLNGFKIIQAEVGIAYDTLYLTNMHGCDSTVYMELAVLPDFDTAYVETICYGEDYTLHGFEYIQPDLGHYIDTLMLLTIDGCDSIIYLDLTVNPVYDTLFTDTICQGDDYTLHGFDILQPVVGFHQDTLWLSTTQGCDSLIFLDLTVAERADTLLIVDICEGDDYIDNGFEYLNPAVGVYQDSLSVPPVVACDSMVYLLLTVHETFLINIMDTICEGEDYMDNGFVVMQPASGEFADTLRLVSEHGCDSLVTLALTVNPRHDITILDTVCNDGGYDNYGFVIDSLVVGTMYDTLNLTNMFGCDSIVMLELTINPRHDTLIIDTICYADGLAYTDYGFQIDSLIVGTMYDTLNLTNIYGCDSIVALELTVNPRHDITVIDTVCEGGVYEEYGFVIDSLVVGMMYDTLFLTNEFGCDSIVMLELAVGALDTLAIIADGCEGGSYYEYGFELDSLEIGTIYDTLHFTSIYGCDSIVTLELTVNMVQDTLFVVTDTICEGGSYYEHGFELDSLVAGMHYDTLWLTNIYGCDSIVRLEMYVNPVYNINYIDEVCYADGYVYNNYGFIIDSIYVGTIYDTLNLQTTFGCDSILTLELTVHPLQDTLFVDHICYDDQPYIGHGFIMPDSLDVGEYLETMVYSDIHGCDSTVILNLFVEPLYDITIQDTICEGDDYVLNGFNILNPAIGMTYDTLWLSSIWGCDSVVKLELRILPVLMFEPGSQMLGASVVYAATNMQTGRYEYDVPSVEHCDEYVWSLEPEGSQWLLDTDSTHCTLWVLTPGNYTLKVKIGNICHWDSLTKNLYGSFFGENDLMLDDVVIYPNPTKSMITLECEGMERVIIQSNMGQIMRKEDFDSSDRVVLNVESLPRGTYIVIVETKKGRSYKQIVIEE